jgi:hypothetical protein
MAHGFSLEGQLLDAFGWKAQLAKAISECGEFVTEAGQLLYLNEAYPDDEKKILATVQRLREELADLRFTCGKTLTEWAGKGLVEKAQDIAERKAFTELENYRSKKARIYSGADV